MKVAFYAPLKAPDHPVPSGDRQMARLLIAALRLKGHTVEMASTLRTFLPQPDAKSQAALRSQAEEETERLAASWVGPGVSAIPDLWFTYHNHYKAPDLLGPAISRVYGLPYVIAEASHAPRRGAAWGSWQVASDTAIQEADAHICFTRRDRTGLESVAKANAVWIDLPPFIDQRSALPAVPRSRGTRPIELVTVAMMRAGDKYASYRFLADALSSLLDVDWRLSIVGDGPVRSEVEAACADIPPDRVRWHGLLASDAVMSVLAAGDIYVWPGFGEAFGLGYLEAQSMGLPVLALDVAGVSSVVQQGMTGILVGEPTPRAYADALRSLIANDANRVAMGRAAAIFVREERSTEKAAGTLDAGLHQLTMKTDAALR